MNRRDLLKAGAAAAAAGSLAGADALAKEKAKPSVPAKPQKAPRLVVRRSHERGRADHGWLKAKFSFSFSRYHDPRHMGFRGLRVLNEDRIAPGGGFPMHPHKDMEIITYVLDGALQHKDNVGNGSVIVPGEVQRMSAGRGIYHSEFNPSKTKGTHLIQIWILPSKRGIKPSWSQTKFPLKERQDGLRVIASPSGAYGSLKITANANVYASVLRKDKPVTYEIPNRRHTWIQVARGSLTVNGVALNQGDALRTSDPGSLELKAADSAEILLFDLA